MRRANKPVPQPRSATTSPSLRPMVRKTSSGPLLRLAALALQPVGAGKAHDRRRLALGVLRVPGRRRAVLGASAKQDRPAREAFRPDPERSMTAC